MSAQFLALDSFWVDKKRYDDAESSYYEHMGHVTLTPLADEIEKARLRLIEIRGNVENEIKSAQKELSTVPLPPQLVKPAEKQNEKAQEKQNKKKNKQDVKPPNLKNEPVQTDIRAVKESTVAEITQSPACNASDDGGTVKFLERKVLEFNKILTSIQSQLSAFNMRLDMIEKKTSAMAGQQPKTCEKPPAPSAAAEDDDDVDLFGSESEDDEAAAKIKEERLAAYNAKKSKKPALIAKSSIILDVKPWDDETDMKMLEGEVRKIVMDGLLWGASKLVPLAYGIHKLQITCVVEDDKVSVDLLTETIEGIEDYVQSVDIAAFNKI